MTCLDELTFDPAEQAILDRIGLGLRGQGWGRGFSTPLTVNWLLAEWNELSVSVDRYTGTIDYYTNHLTTRDGLEIALTECSEPLRAKLELLIGVADRDFVARTIEDTDCLLRCYFRIEDSWSWWWKRRPATGPLADYLTTGFGFSK
jgi:hypothetical protein